ncbi:MAG: indole-3-glycerol phosphate synthase TrpC [Alcanivoracaceae bacterium]|nr:indole-3-glycerol phosphate synthase TrpC [Alcanivoracaceae bacterium]
MSDILTKILDTKLEEIKAGCEKHSLKQLSQSIEGLPVCRDFYQSLYNKLENNQTAVIAEIKKASPSKGLICTNFDPQVVARSYEKAGAACLSVLTDEKYFQGHNDYLQQAKYAVQIPVLRKDFIIDAWQVYQSRVLGADCILLIVAALGDPQLFQLTVLAQELGMEVLMEVHDQAELLRALNTPARLIGINNRNLRTFDTNLDTSVILSQHIPNDRIVISESGIHSSENIKMLQTHGINTFLIGEAFMRKDDPGAALSRMLMC